MTKKIQFRAGLVLLASTAAFAQFSLVPQLVFDPKSAADIIDQTSQILNEIGILTKTYAMTENTYNLLTNNARMISGKGGWSYLMSPLMYPSSTSTFGTSGGWMQSLNTGLASVQNYEMATMRFGNPSAMVGTLSSAGQNNFYGQYSTVELNDGMAQNAMNVTGTYRSQAAARASSLSRLQSESLSDDGIENTEVGVLNKVNSAALISAQTQQDTNNLLAAIADQQTIAAKVRHDLMVDELNSAIAAQAATAQNTSSLWGGDNAAHSARLP